MTTEKKIKIRKKIFPLGMFLLIFIIQSFIVVSAMTLYFISTGKKRIADMEKYTRNYSMTLADAFADVAELSFRTRQYKTLQSLFREKIRGNTIDEAFFVLNNGSIVVHSNGEIEKELSGNIANDEFTYNLDMILAPSLKKSRETHFSDYNIISQRNPFPRDQRDLIEKYLYPDVRIMGWLIGRAVYSGNKPVGTVNFLISKKRIFDFIKVHIEETIMYLRYGLEGSLAMAFLLSLIILFRYRSIQKKTLSFSSSVVTKEGQAAGKTMEKTSTLQRAALAPESESSPDVTTASGEYITIDISAAIEDNKREVPMEINVDDDGIHIEKYEGEIFMEDLQAIEPVREESLESIQRHTVKDAIPAAGKRPRQ
ncbi:MAG: hypothetical protein CVV44_05955 [Spirochaetae bacterium HGW-Spirochaetae-1]|jgi:hypothetical protein|nr:MAG: hypothetical protein CVV44_05955 [Spirochaetae bacterium HGW-Spirochaetae-1]